MAGSFGAVLRDELDTFELVESAIVLDDVGQRAEMAYHVRATEFGLWMNVENPSPAVVEGDMVRAFRPWSSIGIVVVIDMSNEADV